MGWFSFGNTNQNANNKAGSKKPSAMSRRDFLKIGGTAAAGAMILPDVIASSVADNKAALEYAQHLKAFVSFGEDGQLIGQHYLSTVRKMAALGSDEAILAEAAKHANAYELYTQESVHALTRLHGHTKSLSLAEQQKLLHSPEVRAMLREHIQQQMPKGLLSSPKLIERQVENTIQHYGGLLQNGPLIKAEQIEAQQYSAANYQATLEREMQHSAASARAKKQHKAERTLGNDGQDLIASVKPRLRRDGYILQLNPLLKEYPRSEQRAQIERLIHRIETHHYAGEADPQSTRPPHVLISGLSQGFLVVKCAVDSNAGKFFAELAELKPVQHRAR